MQAVFTVLPLRVLRALSSLAGRLKPQAGPSSRSHLRGDQLYDLICMATFICSVGFLWTLNAGAIYFWMKDLNQEWLKLQVIYTAVEIFDKVTRVCQPSAIALQLLHLIVHHSSSTALVLINPALFIVILKQGCSSWAWGLPNTTPSFRVHPGCKPLNPAEDLPDKVVDVLQSNCTSES